MKKQGFLKHGEFEQDFELNITSIIDCFVVLIAFVLVSASFFSIGIIDAEVAGASDTAVSNDPATSVTIELKADHSIVLKSGTFGQNVNRISAVTDGKSGGWSFDRLALSLESLKGETPSLQSAIVVADNSIAYRDVMASMEVAKEKVPHVNLGGF